MKAFTFKKTAVAAALLATAASSIAADAKLESLVVAAGVAAPATDLAVTAKATELAAAGAGAVTIAGQDQALAFTIPTAGAIASNSTVTFSFANGGLKPATYRLAVIDFGSDGVAGGSAGAADTVKFVSTALNFIKSDGTFVSEISFVVNQLLAAGSVVYLVPQTAVVADNWVADKGVEYIIAKGAAANSKLTANIAVSNPNVADNSIYSAKKDLAIALKGLKVNNFGTDIVTNVNFTKGALEFVGGKTVTETGFNITPTTYTSAFKTVTTTAVSDIEPISETELDKFTADLTLSMLNCDAVKVSDSKVYSVTLKTGSSNTVALTKSSDKDCTWTATGVDVHKDFTGSGSDDNTVSVSIEVDGKTKITDNTVTLDYDIKYTDAAASIANKSVNKDKVTVSKWSTNVIGGSTSSTKLSFPFLTASNGSNSAFSLIKLDNTAQVETAVVISGVVEQITFAEGKKVSEFLEFSNYKLSLGDTNSIAAKSLGQISGDDVINSLVKPVGESKFGFNETALTGLKKDAIHHMSVTFQVSSAETPKGAFGKVVAYNSTKSGRIGVVAQ